MITGQSPQKTQRHPTQDKGLDLELNEKVNVHQMKVSENSSSHVLVGATNIH